MKPSKFLDEMNTIKDVSEIAEMAKKIKEELDKRFIDREEVERVIDSIKDNLFSGRNWRMILKKELGTKK